jgi:hypothetical protein
MVLPVDLAASPPPWAEALLDTHPDAAGLRDDADALFEAARAGPVRNTMAGWIAARGRAGLWALFATAIGRFPELPRYGYGYGLAYRGAAFVEPIFAVLQAIDDAGYDWPEVPWLQLELLANVPTDQGPVLNQLRRSVSSIDDPTLLRAGLRHWKMSARRDVVQRLIALGDWTVDDAVAALEDPPLRKPCAAFLRAHPEGPAAAARLRGHRLKSVRRLALDIEREADPAAGLGDGALANAEARLRIDPEDAEASQIWADLLLEQGDPRGQVVMLEHAIRAALATGAHAEAAERSAQLGGFVSDNWDALWDRPGGVPFRDHWRGRTCVAFESDWNHRMRGRGGHRLLDKVLAFLDHLTDAREPDALRNRLIPDGRSGPAPEDGDLLAAARRRLDAGDTDFVLVWRFRWTHPGSSFVLPYQEPGHHAGGGRLTSALTLAPGGRDVMMHLRWPFPGPDDVGFQSFFGECERLLGKAFTKNRFQVLGANARGDALKSRFVSYSSKQAARS